MPRTLVSRLLLSLLLSASIPTAATVVAAQDAEGSGWADDAWGEFDDADDDAADDFDWGDDAGDGDAGDGDAGDDSGWDWDADDGAEDDDFDWGEIEDEIETAAPEEEVDWDAIWEDETEVDDSDNVTVPLELAEDQSGVTGIIVDNEFDEPIGAATVSIDETSEQQVTGPNGVFFFELLPGIYTVRIDHFEYDGSAYQVEIDPGDITDLGRVVLRPDGQVITVVTEGRAIQGSVATQMAERQASTTVQDAIGEEQFSRSTDGSASSAVRRVVGVTIEDGRFLVTRGLSGRYNLVTLNGVPVPKTDPDYPSAELDIFPTDLLSSITLAKNPSANESGGFVGGLMDIETRAYPEDFELSVGLSLSASTTATFREFNLLPGTSADFLGFGGGRSLPDAIPTDGTLATGGLTTTLTEEEFVEIVRAFPDEWEPRRRTAMPNLGAEVSMGDTLETQGSREIGYLLSFTYGYAQTASERQRGSVSSGADGAVQESNLTGIAYQDQIKWGALANLYFELADGHDLRLVSLFNQDARDQFESLTGNDGDNDSGAVRQTAVWRQRTLSFNQLLGRHRRLLPETSPLHETRIDWSAAFSWARRFEPDNRFFTSVRGEWNVNPGSGEHFTSDLTQTDAFGNLQLELPYLDRITFRVGGDVTRSDRSFESRRFRYVNLAPRSSFTDEERQSFSDEQARISELSPEEIFADENVGARAPDLLTLSEVANPQNAYRSEQLGASGFAQVDWKVLQPWRLTAGARLELFNQELTPRQFGRRSGDTSQRSDLDILPSASSVFELTDDAFLRLVYGGSVARPQVREIAPFVFQDYTRRRTVTGNPDLIRTFVHNLDARFEFFPSSSEVVAATFFYKRFLHPIESSGDRAGAVSYFNADSAQNLGVELEVQFDFVHFSDRLEGLSLMSNLSLIRSRIDLPCDDENGDGDCDEQFTNEVRAMVGQAPWTVNASFGYAAPSDVWSIFAFYNVIGPRIETAGVNGLPDSVFEPFHGLDVTATYQFHEHWKLKLGLENLALQRDRETQGGLSVAEDYTGMEIGVSVGWSR